MEGGAFFAFEFDGHAVHATIILELGKCEVKIIKMLNKEMVKECVFNKKEFISSNLSHRNRDKFSYLSAVFMWHKIFVTTIDMT